MFRMFFSGGSIRFFSNPQCICVAFIWLYALVITTGYVGNLVSFLTVKVTIWPFNTLEEMVGVSSYRYVAEQGALYDMHQVTLCL